MNRNINRLKFGGDFGAKVAGLAWVAWVAQRQMAWVAKGKGHGRLQGLYGWHRLQRAGLADGNWVYGLQRAWVVKGREQGWQMAGVAWGCRGLRAGMVDGRDFENFRNKTSNKIWQSLDLKI